MKRFFLFLDIALLIVSLALLSVPTRLVVQAAKEKNQEIPEDTGDCVGLDLVLVVDQSGSMNRINDKGQFRTVAAQDILQHLAINALLECPMAIHRLAVLDFGDYIEEGTDLRVKYEWVFPGPGNQGPPWIEIGGFDFGMDIDAWKTDWLEPKIARIVAKDMDDTDTVTALHEARELLETMRPVNDGLPRQKTVILLTDGRPFVEERNEDSLFADIYQELAKYQDISFWVVALRNIFGEDASYMDDTITDPDDIDSWEKDTLGQADLAPWLTQFLNPNADFADKKTTAGTLWTYETYTHNGQLVMLTMNKREIPETLNIIYEKLLGREGIKPICNEPFYVDAYIQSADFTYTKNNEDISISLKKYQSASQSGGADIEFIIVDGKVVDTNGNEIEKYNDLIHYWSKIGTVEHYVISLPPAGKWEWTVSNDVSCSDASVRYLPMMANAALVYPSGDLPPVAKEPFYDQKNPTYFEVQVEEQDGTPFQTDNLYPLRVTLTYIGPDGKPVQNANGESEWVLLSKGEGIWRSADPVLVPLIGNYDVTLRGTAPAAAPSILDLMIIFERTIPNAFRAPNVQLFDFHVLTPQEGQVLPLNFIKNDTKVTWPIEVTVQVVDVDGKTVPNSAEVVRGEAPFRAVLLNEKGDENEQVDLTLSSKGESIYVGTLRKGENPQLDPEGNYQIRIELAGEWRSENWLPSQRMKNIRISRTLRDSFKLELVTPEKDQKLYPTLVNACSFIDQPGEVEIAIRLLDLEGKPISYDKVIISPDKFEQLLQGQLLGPVQPDGKHVSESLTFEIEDDPEQDGQLLVARAGKSLNQIGEYEIRVGVNQQVLNEHYVKPERDIDLKFERTTSFFSQASTCNTFAGIQTFILAGIIAYLIWLWLGPLHGELTFSELVGTKLDEIGTIPARSLINRRWLNRPGWTSATLRKMGIGKVSNRPWIDVDVEVDEEDRIHHKKEWRGVILELFNRRHEVLLGATNLGDKEKTEFTLDDGRNIQVEYRE